MSQTDPQRQSLAAAHTVVVKLGTQLLTGKDQRLDNQFLAQLARQIVELRSRGVFVAIVSSGAIGAGLGELGLPARPTDLAKLQAVAAVGQRRLMDAWAAAFATHDLPVAQLLLTRQDIDHRGRFLNVRNTLHAIHEYGAIPIINENDTISTDELIRISFGDNDILAALVAHAMQADLLVLMSVVDGLLDAEGKSVRIVESLEDAQELVRAEKSALGKGGMNSKLEAARTLTASGNAMVVVDGRMPDVLPRLLDGQPVGTLFVASSKRRKSRSRWIGSLRPAGAVIVDGGAVKALIENNRSLLAAGIVRVEGDFHRGDCIAVRSPDGRTIACGLSNYTSEEVQRIAGMKTSQVRSALGEAAYDEVVHRDNLVVQ